MTGRGIVVAIALGLVLAVGVMLWLMGNRDAIAEARCDLSPAACLSPTPS